jgi:signal transduction histidine kinase
LWNAFTLKDAVGTRKNSGGLSLSLCKAIIERMNGRIDFSTRTVPNGLPTGTTFFFDLPASLAAPLPRTI